MNKIGTCWTVGVGVLACLAGSVLAAPTVKSYYCKYCGFKAISIRTLTANTCLRHPEGKGNHVLYEGAEKSSYVCKFCGQKAADIRSLTANKCQRNPKGALKGRHEPAL